jgi:hypothetical protein
MTAKTIRYLRVSFKDSLAAYEIPALRGGVIAKVGPEHDRFHNHQTDGRALYRYPLVQYKRLYGKAAMLCLGPAVDDIHQFFTQPDVRIPISGRQLDMEVDRLELHSHRLNVWDRPQAYRIHNWIGLNAEAYKTYTETRSAVARLEMLTRKLKGNILAMAKGLDWYIEDPIELDWHDMPEVRTVKLKGVPVLAFTGHFETNVSLPPFAGLGKSSSLGFGTVSKAKIKSSHFKSKQAKQA